MQTLRRLIFLIIQHFVTKLSNFTNFYKLFHAVLKDFVHLARIKIYSILQIAHCVQSFLLKSDPSALRKQVILEVALTLPLVFCSSWRVLRAKSLVMAKYLSLVFALSVITFSKFRLVQCADECKTHADCRTSFWKYCCGGYAIWGSRDRSCTYDWCLNRYCSSDSDCGNPSLCCRSNKCVNKGCSGCTKNTECSSSHVCCKKTLPFDQTVCAENCIKQTCNSNDDCGGWGECCRSGKCSTECDEKCTSDSECNMDQYCCKTKWSFCGKTCVGEICRIDSDCGARNECCISGKCVDRGCSGCVNNSDCSAGHYCCKKRQWYTDELSECSGNCIGKSCGTNDDCGGPDETCTSNHECAVEHDTFPPWLIAVLTVSSVSFFVAVGILVAVIWYFQKKRPAITPQRGRVPLQNTQYQVQNPQANTSVFTNPNAYQNQLLHSGNVAHSSHNPSTVFLIPRMPPVGT